MFVYKAVMNEIKSAKKELFWAKYGYAEMWLYIYIIHLY